jgi:hypothetical protein
MGLNIWGTIYSFYFNIQRTERSVGECALPSSLHSHPPYRTRRIEAGRPAIIQAELCADDGCEDEGQPWW